MELYIHIPFCMRKCQYCDFLSGSYDSDIRKKYTEALINELLFYAARCKKQKVDSIFIGGGTPTFLETDLMRKILETVSDNYDLSENVEYTIECNPGTATQSAMKMYHEMGINRISIGLQSANDEELKMLGRVHDLKAFLRTFDYARRADFSNINVDIMTCLPHQTPMKLRNTLNIVTMLRPEHISAYDLIIEPGTPFFDLYHDELMKREKGEKDLDSLPDEDMELELTRLTENFLASKGYIQYEVSNFSRQGYACRHNIGYWDRVPYIGTGIGAASLFNETRWSNERDIYSYIKCLDSPAPGIVSINASNAPWEIPQDKVPEKADIKHLSRKSEMEEFFFLGLRKVNGVKRIDFENYFNTTVDAIYGEVIRNLQSENLITEKMGVIALTERGMDISNQVLSEFLLD
jgi:oxygen-independent coproporphyrinogen-3 oxidase